MLLRDAARSRMVGPNEAWIAESLPAYYGFRLMTVPGLYPNAQKMFDLRQAVGEARSPAQQIPLADLSKQPAVVQNIIVETSVVVLAELDTILRRHEITLEGFCTRSSQADGALGARQSCECQLARNKHSWLVMSDRQ